jgi:MFS family permease
VTALAGRLGALAERNFRLLFTSTAISALGDGVAIIALAFAVLQVSDSPVALGIVIAGRQVAQSGIVLAAGVWSDRLPRHLVLFGAAAVQGTAQALSGALVLAGHGSIAALCVLQVLYGLANGFVIPASQGLIPHTVTAAHLQDANALLGLTRHMTGIAGPALGGVLVAAGSPGAALLVDAASFGVEALLLLRLRIPPRADVVDVQPFLAELREGWSEFRSRTWLWAIVAQFSLVNALANGSFNVLGPGVAKRHLGGAAAWGLILSAEGAGLIGGGLLTIRLRPRRILLAATLGVFPLALPLLLLGFPAPTAAIVAGAAIGGLGIEMFGVLWDTAMQQEIPQEKLSRVSSWDALGSWVLMPVGLAIAGPVGAAIGTRATLWAAAALTVGPTAAVLLARDVRTLERRTV